MVGGKLDCRKPTQCSPLGKEGQWLRRVGLERKWMGKQVSGDGDSKVSLACVRRLHRRVEDPEPDQICRRWD